MIAFSNCVYVEFGLGARSMTMLITLCFIPREYYLPARQRAERAPVDTLIGHSVIGYSVIGHSVIGHSVIGSSVMGPSVIGYSAIVTFNR